MAQRLDPRRDGTYWGTKDGKVRSVDQYLEANGVYLTSMNEDGVITRHAVVPGRDASSEVVIVFGLTNVRFVHAMDSGTEHEQKVRDELAAIVPGKTK